MPTLLLTIFLIQLSVHLINTIGASAINELVRPYPAVESTSLPLFPCFANVQPEENI
jgi:hypothetical protein